MCDLLSNECWERGGGVGWEVRGYDCVSCDKRSKSVFIF